MSRRILIVFILLLSIVPTPQAGADPEPKPRSRIVAAILERFAPGYDRFCFIGSEVSREFKPRPFELPPTFHERFTDGRFDEAQVNDTGCPTPERTRDDCHWGCVVVLVFDSTAFGYPTHWEPWPGCNEETISFSSSYREGPNARLILWANIYRDGLFHASDYGSHNYLTIVEIAPCTYNVHDKRGIE
ncbi:hypothetical protein [Dongia deserti]|uniref:hypothetical protein n=1 Tax=Dongia deserti TaxID=2268030 RepID=UPI000E648783|nr:hypothetical protein [Dongia deserti]